MKCDKRLTEDGECGGGLGVALGVLGHASDFSHVALGGRVDLQDDRAVGIHDLLVVRPVDVDGLSVLQPEGSIQYRLKCTKYKACLNVSRRSSFTLLYVLQ